jgi:hypothetical protein
VTEKFKRRNAVFVPAMPAKLHEARRIAANIAMSAFGGKAEIAFLGPNVRL